ncbi:MAG: hypothetical protein PVJ09_00205 [Candidatus Woesebacteria bacterium]|jgi:hypothetical protein
MIPSKKLTKKETSELKMIAGQMIDHSPKLTERHISTILKQRGTAMSYHHKDNQKALDNEFQGKRDKKQILTGAGIFLLLFIALVGYFDRQYIKDILQIISGFLAGGGAGYFYGKKSK